MSSWNILSPCSSFNHVAVQLLTSVWLCGPMDCSMPGFPVLHYLPEFAQTHVHWVSDAIQPSPYTYALIYIGHVFVLFKWDLFICIPFSKTNFPHLTVHHGNSWESTGIALTHFFEWLHTTPLCGHSPTYYWTIELSILGAFMLFLILLLQTTCK